MAETWVISRFSPKPRSVRSLTNLFFSSRRRHTRSLRDWSSDVCSSDLSFDWTISPVSKFTQKLSGLWKTDDFGDALYHFDAGISTTVAARRSEERRVGKEGRSRRARPH